MKKSNFSPVQQFRAFWAIILIGGLLATAAAEAKKKKKHPRGNSSHGHYTGYSGNPKCDPGTGGGNKSAGGRYRPLDHTWENSGTAPGSFVMLAVDPGMWKQMKHCTGKLSGKTVRVEDTCPAFRGSGLRHIDISHTCRMDDNGTGEVIWDATCKGLSGKGQHDRIKSQN